MIRHTHFYKNYVVMAVIAFFITMLQRNLIFSGADYILLVALIVMCIICHRVLRMPSNSYMILFVFFILMMVVNSIISSYTPNLYLTILALFLSVCPFLVFIVSYSVLMSYIELIQYINILIKCIFIIAISMYIETVIFNLKSEGILSSYLFMPGFAASLFNQAIILCLTLFMLTKQKKYLQLSTFFIVTIFMTFQFKAIIGTLILISIYLIIKSKNKFKTIVMISCVAVMMIVVGLQLPGFRDKMVKYTKIYNVSDEESTGIARVALYMTAFKIANEYFPFGTGQGSYGSVPVNIVYSKVYSDYNIDKVYGLGWNDKVNFRMDTHWATILGENGYLGILLYVLLMLYPYRFYMKKIVKRNYAFVFFSFNKSMLYNF